MNIESKENSNSLIIDYHSNISDNSSLRSHNTSINSESLDDTITSHLPLPEDISIRKISDLTNDEENLTNDEENLTNNNQLEIIINENNSYDTIIESESLNNTVSRNNNYVIQLDDNNIINYNNNINIINNNYCYRIIYNCCRIIYNFFKC